MDTIESHHVGQNIPDITIKIIRINNSNNHLSTPLKIEFF